ncbi:MAG TPA: PQQ-binding-like beta-propeller repeat protein [Candidatus Thermoplasmatota archaeon]|nr:PQQ-binding-like beta-propeller repeat protein [Candidatus Thermoplasmatota archaeon]
MLNSAKAWEYGTYGPVTCTALSQGGEYLVAGSQDGNLYAFTGQGELLWTQTLGAPVARLAYSLNGNYLAAATAGHGESLINFYGINGALLWSRKVGKAVRGLSISDDGGIVVIGSDNRNIYCVNYEGNLIFNHRLGGEIPSVAQTRDSRLIYAGAYDAFVYCFDLQGRGIWNYKTTGPVEKVLVTRQGDLVFAVSSDKRLYQLSKTGSMLTNQRFDELPSTVAIDETARTMALSQGSDLLLLHHKDTAVYKRVRLDGRILEVAVSENGEHVAAFDTSNVLHFFDRELNELWRNEFSQKPTALAISPKGHYLGVGCNDKKVYLLDNKNYYKRTLEGVRRAVDEAKQSGMVVLEADVLAQKAEQELEAEAFSAALKYADAAVKIISRQRERAKPQISVLGVVGEAFRSGKPNTVRAIVMNTGMGHAKNISFRFEGEVRTEVAPAREFLSVGAWYEDNWEVVPTKKGESVVRFRTMWHDAGDSIQTAESPVAINVVESEKALPYKKSAPLIQLGNVQKLIARVQADKAAGRIPAPPPSATPSPGADAVVQEVQALKCKKCGNLLQEDWKACPRCMAPVG